MQGLTGHMEEQRTSLQDMNEVSEVGSLDGDD